jgi:serine/threonine protein kinase
MTLSMGDKLGHYEIVAQAGAGGMGEVYKARDTRLKRTVALKVLTAQSARFEREARTVASLNHPHICVLHDIGHENGRPYMVMEFLEMASHSSTGRHRMLARHACVDRSHVRVLVRARARPASRPRLP